jgi:TonB family protein
MPFSIRYRCLSDAHLFVRGFLKIIIAIIFSVLLSLNGLAVGAVTLPPETFLNLPIGVMGGVEFNKLSMTIKEFLAMHPQDSVVYEQNVEGQWICRLNVTDKLSPESHEISIFFTEQQDAKAALLSRVIVDQTVLGEKARLTYGIALATIHRGESSLPQVQGKVASDQTLKITLRISGTAGSNPYWARVQSIISSQWEPPPIDKPGQTYRVIVKFRLQRDGTIKDAVVQQSSGNAYFDMAGQRAVLRPRALPAFPADMTGGYGYKDIEVEFRVGELSPQQLREEREQSVVRAAVEQRDMERDRAQAAVKMEQDRAQAAVKAAVGQIQRENQRLLKADSEIKFQSLLSKYHAEDISSPIIGLQFSKNPYVYRGKAVFLTGMYVRNIGPDAAIVAVAVINSAVQWNTSRNLAAEPEGTIIRCVVRMLGTIMIQQGLNEREIPNVKELECLK